MRFLNALALGTSLALGMGLPAHAATHCTQAEQGRWLNACAWALNEVRIAEHPGERDDNGLFRAQSSLSKEFTDSCYQLLSQPDRVPAEAFELLSDLGWPLLIHDPCTRSEHLQWLAACEQDALALKGQTRADLLVKFSMAGGFSPDFLHNTCADFKIEVNFRLKHEGAESPDDVIESVTPYLGAIEFD
jgi:hypothetical protein